MSNENFCFNVLGEYSELKLLYLMGNEELDTIIEEFYPGEDVFVSFSSNTESLILSIEEQSTRVDMKSVTKIQLLYEEGQIILMNKSDEYVFSYEDFITMELLSFFYNLEVPLEFPEFLSLRYIQMQDKRLYSLIEKYRQTLPENEFIYFYDEIFESAYSAIAETFAPHALDEAPLLYIKYFDNDTKPSGLLVTSKRIYSPENSRSLTDIDSIRFQEKFDYTDSINCYINDKLFCIMKLIIWDKPLVGFAVTYQREFFAKDIFKLTGEICEYVKTKPFTD